MQKRFTFDDINRGERKKRANARNTKRRELRDLSTRRRIGANLRKRRFRGDANAQRHAQNVSCHEAAVHGKPSTPQSLPLSGHHTDRVHRRNTLLYGRAYELLSYNGGLRVFLFAPLRDLTTRNSANAISPCRAIRVSCSARQFVSLRFRSIERGYLSRQNLWNRVVGSLTKLR